MNFKNIGKYIVLCLVLFVSACSSTKDINYNAKPCEVYNDAVDEFNKKNYSYASENLEALQTAHPFSDVMDKSQFLLGKSYFLSQKFTKSIDVLKMFNKMYPNDSRVVEADYMIAMAYWYSSSTYERDLTFLKMAYDNMDAFIKKYPNNPNDDLFRKKMVVARNSLAKREMLSSVYQMNDKDFAGAINRLQNILYEYKDTDMVPEAYYRLVESYASIEGWEQAQYFKDKLNSTFPDNRWAKKANKWFDSAVKDRE